jgi:hypothetical protein
MPEQGLAFLGKLPGVLHLVAATLQAACSAPLRVHSVRVRKGVPIRETRGAMVLSPAAAKAEKETSACLR